MLRQYMHCSDEMMSAGQPYSLQLCRPGCRLVTRAYSSMISAESSGNHSYVVFLFLGLFGSSKIVSCTFHLLIRKAQSIRCFFPTF